MLINKPENKGEDDGDEDDDDNGNDDDYADYVQPSRIQICARRMIRNPT